MKMVPLLLVAQVLAAGCDGEQRDSAAREVRLRGLEQALERDEERLALAEQRLQEQEQRYSRLLQELRDELAEQQRTQELRARTLSGRVEAQERELVELREQLAARSPEVGAEAEREEEVAVEVAAATDEAVAETGDFPLELSEVRTVRRPVGTVIRREMVETGEMKKDRFGRKQPVPEMRETEVVRYGHAAALSIRNRSGEEQRVTLRAGGEAVALTLAAGAERVDLEVPLTLGADLLITANGFRRSVEVPDPPPEP